MARFSTFPVVALSLLFVIGVVTAAASPKIEIYNDLTIRVQRNIDLTSQLARQFVQMTLTNTGTQSASHFYFALEEPMARNLAWIHASEESGASLTVHDPSELQTKNGVQFRYYRIDLGRSLASQDSMNLLVQVAVPRTMAPLPAEIAQTDKQLVLYSDNVFFFSPYTVNSQKTVIKLASAVIEDYTKKEPFNHKGDVLTYGPYSDIAPYTHEDLFAHFENDKPFVAISTLTRIIEVSHWGNVNVEEWYELKHEGAKLRGQFSRFDYRRQAKGPFVRSITHLLPTDAHNIYYRDEIGNISTSAVMGTERGIFLDLTPRFPLFGGWKTKFYMGYDLPLPGYLFNDVQDSSRFMLNVSFAKDFTSDIIIDELVIKVILPEGVKDIKTHLPFAVDSESRDVHFTYLDVYGRPVVVITKKNVIAEHNEFFQVTYHFSKLSMLLEPILLIGVYFFFFVFAMLYVRFNLSITDTEKVSAAEDPRVIELLNKVKKIHAQRNELHNNLREATEKLGKSKNSAQYNSEKKSAETALNRLQTEMLLLTNELEELDEDHVVQVRQIERAEHQKQTFLDELLRVENQHREKQLGKSVFEQSKQQFEKNYNRVDEEIDILIGDLLQDL